MEQIAINEERLQRLLGEDFHFRRGKGKGVNGEVDACIMQAVDWLAGGTGATDGEHVGHYCEKISPGCANCYASKFQARVHMPPFDVRNREKIEVFLDREKLRELTRRKKPARIFPFDMTDLFGEWVTFETLDEIWTAFARSPKLTLQVLTKRIGRAREYLTSDRETFRRIGYNRDDVPISWPLPNVWMGTSVETKDYLWRIDELRECPATIRFLSLEPLLGDLGVLDLRGIHWVIVGGESGPKARPMHPDWVRSIREQCKAAGIPFFFKQWGAYRSHYDIREPHPKEPTLWMRHDGKVLKVVREDDMADGGEWLGMYKFSKKQAGRELDRETYSEFPSDGRS